MDRDEPQPIIERDLSPLAIFSRALETRPDIDPDKLSKLLDLHERLEARQAEKEYTEAMNRCQRRMPPVLKTKQNSHTKNSYAPLEEIDLVVKPIYLEEGFTLSFTQADSPKPDHIRLVASCAHVGGHKTSHFMDLPIDGTGAKGNSNMSAIQGNGSSVTYGTRYLTTMIFRLTIAGADTDGTSPNRRIDETQELTLRNLIDACGRSGKPVNLDRFYDWLSKQAGRKIVALADLPAVCFAQAETQLQSRLDAKPKETNSGK